MGEKEQNISRTEQLEQFGLVVKRVADKTREVCVTFSDGSTEVVSVQPVVHRCYSTDKETNQIIERVFTELVPPRSILRRLTTQ